MEFLTLVEKKKYVKIIFTVLGGLFVLNGLLELFEINKIKNSFVSNLPPYIYGDSLKYVLEGNILNIRVIICSIFFFLMMLSIFMIMVYFVPIRAFNLLNQYDFLNRTTDRFISLFRIQRMINVLPSKIRLLCAKEIIQITREKNTLFSVFTHTLMAGSIMIISSSTVDAAAMQIGIFVSVAYMSFIMALYSIPRETNYIWLFKSLDIEPIKFVISKYLANLFVSVPLSGVVFLGYLLLARIVVGASVVDLKNIMQGYIWSIGTVIPLSIIWGIIVGALLPYKVMIKKKKITYKFNGIEGAVLSILVFVVVVPAFLLSQMYQYWSIDLGFCVYFLSMFVFMLYRAGTTYKKME